VLATAAEAEIEVLAGGPPELLIELSEKVDLLVIGSRRWGAVSRVLLGTTGEALMNDAACPIIVAPRPAS
jgi:nucleotide-binding universal stress UspA family protein